MGEKTARSPRGSETPTPQQCHQEARLENTLQGIPKISTKVRASYLEVEVAT